MYVQYVIRNESNKKLTAKFAVESNFANTNFNPENIIYNSIELADNDERIELDTTKSSEDLVKSSKIDKITAARITDTENGLSFVFEPNEGCSFCYNPIIFKRPRSTAGSIEAVDLTTVSTLIWDIEIEPGMETEKNINFTIIPTKRTKKVTV